ncbi:hypothetical protein RS030_3464 [Cryptosporidium xiaoi]|uniref:EF-hand domain-containing protein n=1 Tax=Cryptosporidium xiaoi TaxID=659607 RepID=A0AAV9XXL8_9CRYT
MSQDKWFVTRFSEYKVKRNTNINNIANILEDETQSNYFDIPDDVERNTLYMCYELYSTFDYDGKGYIPLKLLEEWSKTRNELLQKSTKVNTNKYDRYKSAIQRMCNSIETYKNRYLSKRDINVKDDTKQKNEEDNVINEDDTIFITISEFINFCAPIFDEISSFEVKGKSKSHAKTDSIHFKTSTETNIALTNYFGTVTNIPPNGEFTPLSSSPSSYLEPTCNNVMKGVSIPMHNPVLYITDSNLYHNSLWNPCKEGKIASLLTWGKDIDDIQRINDKI